MNVFHPITLSRKDLQKVLDSFDTGEYVHFGLEIDTVDGDQVLWVDNGRFDDLRKYRIINQPHDHMQKL